MKIAYIAKHGNGFNDDEGAITFSLRKLGHEVVCIQEIKEDYSPANACDFALFHHHWTDLQLLKTIKVPRVFWMFDLIDHPVMKNRLHEHVQSLMQLADLGFCTDGDYAARYPHKLRRLKQGADERVAGYWSTQETQSVLFAGNYKYPISRKRDLRNLEREYPAGTFTTLTSPGDYVYREKLALLVGRHKAVLGLPDPVKADYWSNRVYMICGFGGVLVHPRCQRLLEDYTDGEDLLLYNDRTEMRQQIDRALADPALRARIRASAYRKTVGRHTYTHRCQKLIETVQQELFP